MEAHHMKILSAALTAVVLMGFAGAVSAECPGYGKAAVQSAQAPLLPPEGAAGS
jgi:hypothetical protein